MIIPTIHLNGTSRDSLLEGYAASVLAIRNAIVVLGYTAPNARDYYPQGAWAYQEALGEHRARLAKLDSVLAEIEAIAEAVAG